MITYFRLRFEPMSYAFNNTGKSYSCNAIEANKFLTFRSRTRVFLDELFLKPFAA